jgi:hypothetical protein
MNTQKRATKLLAELVGCLDTNAKIDKIVEFARNEQEITKQACNKNVSESCRMIDSGIYYCHTVREIKEAIDGTKVV